MSFSLTSLPFKLSYIQVRLSLKSTLLKTMKVCHLIQSPNSMRMYIQNIHTTYIYTYTCSRVIYTDTRAAFRVITTCTWIRSIYIIIIFVRNVHGLCFLCAYHKCVVCIHVWSLQHIAQSWIIYFTCTVSLWTGKAQEITQELKRNE